MIEAENIYSTVPSNVIDGSQESYVKARALKDFLKENKGKFFSAKKLAAHTDYSIQGSCVELRKAITKLIEIQFCPIVSCSSGYAWALHKNQIRKYIESLEYRIKGVERRILKLRQIEVDFDE